AAAMVVRYPRAGAYVVHRHDDATLPRLRKSSITRGGRIAPSVRSPPQARGRSDPTSARDPCGKRSGRAWHCACTKGGHGLLPTPLDGRKHPMARTLTGLFHALSFAALLLLGGAGCVGLGSTDNAGVTSEDDVDDDGGDADACGCEEILDSCDGGDDGDDGDEECDPDARTGDHDACDGDDD